MADTQDWDERVDRLVEALRQFRARNVFNQWDEADSALDCNNAPKIRRNNLREYLKMRLEPRYVFIGEAPSWKGTRFSGTPMTSERILLRKHRPLRAINVIPCVQGRRTSKINGTYANCDPTNSLAELSATNVWETSLDCHLSATDFVLWNAMPWHPHNNGTTLSNRESGKFTCEEIEAGRCFLHRVNSELYPLALWIAFSKYATLELLKAKRRAVSHPSQRRGTFSSKLKQLICYHATSSHEDKNTLVMSRS